MKTFIYRKMSLRRLMTTGIEEAVPPPAPPAEAVTSEPKKKVQTSLRLAVFFFVQVLCFFFCWPYKYGDFNGKIIYKWAIFHGYKVRPPR